MVGASAVLGAGLHAIVPSTGALASHAAMAPLIAGLLGIAIGASLAYGKAKWRIGAGWKKPVPVLLLEHVGRKSGKRYETPLLYMEDGEDLVVVASQGFVFQYWLGGTTQLSLPWVSGTMAGTHLLIGIGEGLIAATTVATVARVRPDLVYALRRFRKPPVAVPAPAPVPVSGGTA